MTARWSVRAARAEDAERVERFFLSIDEFAGEARAGEERDVWRWLYHRADVPGSLALVAEIPDGTVIGHYGISALDYVVDGSVRPAGVLCKLAVDARYRHEPLALQLALRLLRAYADGGPSFAQALANRAGLREFHVASGCVDLGAVPVCAKPIRLRKVAAARIGETAARWLAPALRCGDALLAAYDRVRLRTPAGVTIERVDSLAEVTDAETALAVSHRVFARRTPAFLDRRFVRAPFRDYALHVIRSGGTPVGYVVLRRMPMKQFDALAIVDLCFDFRRLDIARAVGGFVAARARALGCDLVAVLASSSALRASLRPALFRETGEEFRLLAHGLRTGADDPPPPAAEWFVTWYDHDYV